MTSVRNWKLHYIPFLFDLNSFSFAWSTVTVINLYYGKIYTKLIYFFKSWLITQALWVILFVQQECRSQLLLEKLRVIWFSCTKYYLKLFLLTYLLFYFIFCFDYRFFWYLRFFSFLFWPQQFTFDFPHTWYPLLGAIM